MNQKIIETKYWVLELAENQYYLGRSYIILKRDSRLLSKITSKEAEELFQIIKKMETALKKAFGATMFNWTCLMNDAYKAKNPKPQVHLHCWPRYKKIVKFEGEVFHDEVFAHHYDKYREKKLNPKILKKIVDKIKAEISF
ncbi:HIT family protein [Candidatus Pacearchaeota archaeon]|nr:HIT family protein [Candidatus Pacearchaeota archaeon]